MGLPGGWATQHVSPELRFLLCTAQSVHPRIPKTHDNKVPTVPSESTKPGPMTAKPEGRVPSGRVCIPVVLTRLSFPLMKGAVDKAGFSANVSRARAPARPDPTDALSPGAPARAAHVLGAWVPRERHLQDAQVLGHLRHTCCHEPL